MDQGAVSESSNESDNLLTSTDTDTNITLKKLSLPSLSLLMSSANLTIIAGVIGNVLSVVGVVICNKYITEVDGYNFMVFLSFLHFVFTTLGTRVFLGMNIFTFQPAPLSGVLPVAIVCHHHLLSLSLSPSLLMDPLVSSLRALFSLLLS
jgi:hypothetical protein